MKADGVTDFGTFTTDANNCVVYTAGHIPGNKVDTICVNCNGQSRSQRHNSLYHYNYTKIKLWVIWYGTIQTTTVSKMLTKQVFPNVEVVLYNLRY